MMITEEHLRSQLLELIKSSPPKISGLARWVLDHFDLVAFNSIRSLATEAGVDPNLVPRLARALGFDGFDPFRNAVQQIVAARGKSYGGRARALRAYKESEIFSVMIAAGRENFEAVTAPDTLAEIEECAKAMITARRIHVVGVRSCFSLAHYLSYVGSTAFANFVQVPSMPGEILDQMASTGPKDIVVAITYEHYSAEVVRACQVARERRARIVAITDALSSPVAQDAWKVLLMPMAGPQIMPSLASAFLMVEMLLASMAARSDEAATRISDFESRIASFGGYY